MQDLVLIKNLQKKYKTQPVLKGVNIEIAQGEIFSLVGVNGAGKTTLIKCLLNFHTFDAGELTIEGEQSTGRHARDHLAYLPERFLPPHFLNGQQFLNYIFDLHQAKVGEDSVLMMLEELDLSTEILKKPVRQYSKGMAQKLGLAALFLLNKKLLVLDEPMSGLDPKARALVKKQLLQARENGSTIFFSSHLLADVEELSDRIAILHDGIIAFCGTPQQCRHEYRAENLEQAFLECIE